MNKKFIQVLSSLDISPSLHSKILNENLTISLNDKVKIKKYILSQYMNGGIKQGKHTKEYWLCRGWNILESVEKAKQFYNKCNKKRKSPFSIDFWMSKLNEATGKLYTKEEASYKVLSMRPVHKEYWINKGYSEEDATVKANDIFVENSRKGTITSKLKYGEFLKFTNPLNIKYWLKRGYTEEQAKQLISERQTTFSKEKCIEKYGEEEGLKRWKDRQQKWQETLNNKTPEEIERINKNKSSIGQEYFKEKFENNILEYVKYLKEVRKVDIITDKKDFDDRVLKLFENNPCHYYKPTSKKIKLFPRVQYDILNIDPNIYFKDSKWSKKGKFKEGTYGWNIWVQEGLIRSSLEYKFYEILKKYNLEFEISKQYKDSKMLCDFYIKKYDLYIEICGLTDEKYKLKMLKKKKLFNCVLLDDPKEYENYVISLVREK